MKKTDISIHLYGLTFVDLISISTGSELMSGEGVITMT